MEDEELEIDYWASPVDSHSPPDISETDREILLLGEELASIANREEADTEMGNDQPFCVHHHRHYHEGGIIDSVPIIFGQPQYGALRRLEFRYVMMNHAYEQAQARNRKDYKFVRLIAPLLSTLDKKLVYNRLRTGKCGLIPVKVAIVRVTKDSTPSGMARVRNSTVETVEFGEMPIDDSNDIPLGLAVGYVYRFESTTGRRFFRLGWTVRDEEKAHKLRQP